jgi:putative intracellular protease/amidase
MAAGYVLRYPECILDEVAPAVVLLETKHQVHFIDLSDLPSEPINADFLLIPGGSCDPAIGHAGVRTWIRTLHAAGKPIGAICNGALVLADSGVLDGKACTHTAHPNYAQRPQFTELLDAAERIFVKTTYVDQDVVRADRLLTAKPWAADHFGRQFLELLEESLPARP